MKARNDGRTEESSWVWLALEDEELGETRRVRRHGPHGRRGQRPLLTSGLLLLAIGAGLVSAGGLLWKESTAPRAALAEPPPAVVEPQQQPVLITPPAPTARKRATGKPASAIVDPEAAPPERVRIPRIGVDSTLVGLRRLRDGTLEVPRDFAVAGWYRQGVKPGDTGAAVLVGHVDSFTGPAVFFRLRELHRGDRITVLRSDGSRAVFAVYATERVPKDDFPTARVYGDTRGAELRLLTCGGQFDQRTRHYEDNQVVYARKVRA